jgi:putative membrane protein
VICLSVFAVVWVVLAVSPSDRMDWLLENGLTFIAVPLLLWSYRRHRLSDRAYVQITVFLVLHTIGSHYTYAEVPAGFWVQRALGLARNHYDRLVHFSFGLLMLRPIRELGFGGTREPGPVAVAYFTIAGVALWSCLYEVLEWAVAAIVDPAAGTAYLGTQGDQWDAEKDMGLAVLGAVIAAAIEWRRARH